MSYIYIGFVDTPGFFATLIRRYLKQKYVHVVISMDENMDEAYSIGRRDPFIPFFAGFEKEDKNRIYGKFPGAQYMVSRIQVSRIQKDNIYAQLRRDYRRRFRYHYAILGLVFLLMGRPYKTKTHFTCSSYIAKLLEDNGIRVSDKHFSLVTPRDFYMCLKKDKVFEGDLKELVNVGGEAGRSIGVTIS